MMASSDTPPELARAIKQGRGTRSQTEVASLAGVSNKTVSEYERGKFGTTGRPQPDVVAKLALALGANPADWFRMAGLEFRSEHISQAAREVAARQQGAEGLSARRQPYLNTVEELRTSRAPHVRIGIQQSNDTYQGFDRGIIETLCGLINHRWTSEITYQETVTEQIDALFTPVNRSHVAVGIIETLSRSSMGITFIPYPGIEYGLNAVCVRDRQAVSWQDLQEGARDIIAVTIRNEAGDEYLRSVCGYDSGALIPITERNPELVRKAFEEACAQHPSRPVIVCATEEFCYEVIQSALAKPWMLLTDLDASAHHAIPKYRVGCAVRYEDREWCDLLNLALKYAFHYAPVRLANLYADLLAPLVPRDNPTSHKFTFGRLAPIRFEGAEEFISQLRRVLPERLKQRKVFASRDYTGIIEHIVGGALDVGNSFPAIDARLRAIETRLVAIENTSRDSSPEMLQRQMRKKKQ